MSNSTIRVTASVRTVQGKKDPSKTYGFQTCGLQTELGMFKEFDRMFSPDRGEKPLPEGLYEVQPKPAYVDHNGNLRMGFDFVPVKQAAKAA